MSHQIPLPSFLCLFLLLLLLPFSSSSSFSNSNFISSLSLSNSPWTPSQNLTLLSPNSTFAAGFLPLQTSSHPSFTFSVWYHSNSNSSDQTPVWSTSPVSSSGSLSIASSGHLLLLSTPSGNNLLPPTSNSTSLILSDLGDLQFGNFTSFDYPTDTFLPNQTLPGTQLISRNGKFRFTSLTNLTFNASDTYWTSQNGAFQSLNPDGTITIQNAVQYRSTDFKETRLRRLTLDDDGNLRIYSFYPNRTPNWIVVWTAVQEICLIHGLCGVNAVCTETSGSDTRVNCLCLPGYIRVSGSGDCQIKTPFNTNTKFLQLDYVNFTADTVQAVDIRNFEQCESKCRAIPSCLGFGFKFDGTRYCSLQIGTRLLNGYWSPGNQAAMFLRVDGLETDVSNFTGMNSVLETSCPVRIGLPNPPDESRTTARNIGIIAALFALELVIGTLSFWAFIKKYVKYRDMARTLGLELLPTGGPKRFSYADIKAATKDFSSENMIGRGGFSDVYKGELRDGRLVAIKCLKNVTGGDAEFWAEVTIIARMHHLNLVRLWGFCNEKGQRVLIYEHVSNGSLDKFLFEQSRAQALRGEDREATTRSGQKPMLDWNIRYRIAVGVARAIAYLHEECLEWVLHCDIKPENILLGDDFCPKVADFGLSKLKKKEQVVSMSRIRGTRGYVAPEWVKSEPISSKADVYSFGMVLLEMVTGNRNFMMQDSEMDSAEWYLPRWAFDKVFKEMKIEDILDNRIKQSYDDKMHFKLVDRMVKTAMWCIQEKQDMRPSMGKVAKMLEGTVEIMEPPKPTIFYIADD